MVQSETGIDRLPHENDCETVDQIFFLPYKMKPQKLANVGLGVALMAVPFLFPVVMPAAVAVGGAEAVEGAAAAAAVEGREAFASTTTLARTTGRDLKKVEAPLQGGGGGAAPKVGSKRAREEIIGKIGLLQEFRTLTTEKRTELLQTMPEELAKLHRGLCKIAPGHFEGIPLKYATDRDRLAVSLSTKNPNQKFWGVYNPLQKVITLDKAFMERQGTYNTQEVVFHEAAHVVTGSPGHTPLFKESHEVLWVRAYGHGLLSRQDMEASVERVNQFVQKDLDKIALRRQQPVELRKYTPEQLDKMAEERLNMQLDVSRHLKKAGDADEQLLRTYPFPSPPSEGGGGAAPAAAAGGGL